MSYRPPDHPSLSPYCLVASVEEALAFIGAVFGGTVRDVMHGEGGDIRHASVAIDGSILMLGAMAGGDPINLHLYVPDVDAVYESAIRHGATSVELPAPQPYGDRRGAVRDPSGIVWWLSTHGAPGE